MPGRPRLYATPFSQIFPLYVRKAERKGRTREEVEAIVTWLTGHAGEPFQRHLDEGTDLETFLERSPRWHPNADKVTGVVCGVRVEEITDPVMRKIRILDKLIDELARGKKLESILRA